MNPASETTGPGVVKGRIIVTEPPKFDLDSYISNYTGRTRYARLFLIGTSSTVLAVEALKAAIAEAKAGSDIDRYVVAVGALKLQLKPGDEDGIEDQAWMDQKEKQNQAETKRLEAELKGYKNNLIKESIRMGNEELGSHHHATGNLTAATKAYSRMRDYCTTPAHIASTSFRMIETAIDQNNWLAVQSAVHKIRSLQLQAEEQAKAQARTQAALGLCQMHMYDYRDAAHNFLATSSPSLLNDRYSAMITSNDVAVYGGLCALASMTRGELQSQVLDHSTFRGFLELEPHIRRAINLFCAAKYAQCLDILESHRADYLLDLHLQRHVPGLYESIRTKSIVQYFAPFSRVTLDNIANTFFSPLKHHNPNHSNNADTSKSDPDPDPSVQSQSPEIISELTQLISTNTLNAKIDLEHGVLVADHVDQRSQVHSETLEGLDKFKREAHAKLMRMEFLRAGMEINKPDPRSGGGGVGFGVGVGVGAGAGALETSGGGMGLGVGLGGGHSDLAGDVMV